MRIRTGTSGFSYKEWKGPFYPEKHPDKEMLSYYAGKLSTVEINNTFYRMPRASMLEDWREKVPAGFTFVIKASQRITHRARLKPESRESVEYLWNACAALGERLGPILFQCPPYLKKDAERLRAFVASLPEGLRAVFEFRHESWFDDEVVGILSDGRAALCAADTDPERPPRLEATAAWGYLRLRREDYTEAELDAWVERIRAVPWEEVFVFFKHEDAGAGPRMAVDFARRFGG